MSCILRISGDNMDLDKLVKEISIQPSSIFRKGQPLFLTRPNYKLHPTNEVQFVISDDNFDNINSQIKDAIIYLKKNQKQLKKLTFDKTVDKAVLDFGHDLRAGFNNIVAQFDYFPHELLKLAGDLKMDIGNSLYPPNLEN